MTRAGDREKTRLALIEGAREVIATHGVRGASVDAISRRAGVTKGAFYYAFPGKADLLIELARTTSVTLLGHGVDLLSLDAQNAAAALRAAVAASRDEVLLQVELWLEANRDPRLRAQFESAVHVFGGPLDEALGEASVADPATAALAMRSLLLGLVLQLLLIEEGISQERLAAVLGMLQGAIYRDQAVSRRR